MRKLLLLAALSLALSGVASATTITSENVTVDLETSNVEIDIAVEELTSSEFSLVASYPIEDVHAQIGGEEADCEVISSPLQSEIRCPTDLRNNFDVKINYSSQGLVESRNGKRVFSYSQTFFRPTENYRLTAILPKGFVLAEGANVSRPYSPSSGEISSDGQRISITWTSKPGLGGEGEFYQAVYERAASGPDVVLWISIVLGMLLVAGAGYGGYIFLTRESVESIYDELNDDEIELIELVRENEGEMLQKDIVEQLDYSKAKVSGLVSKLVEREVLTKQKEGRSNKLAISRRYRT